MSSWQPADFVLLCCLLLDACVVLPSQLDNATNTATPITQAFTDHQVTVSHAKLLLSLFLYLLLHVWRCNVPIPLLTLLTTTTTTNITTIETTTILSPTTTSITSTTTRPSLTTTTISATTTTRDANRDDGDDLKS